VSIQVSIVEDDNDARQLLAEMIRRADGFALLSDHGSVEAALAWLPAQQPDVVLMDINLPGLSGIDGVRRLKPRLPGTQFMMLTVYEDTNHVFSALAAGATGYLIKQTPLTELLAAIKEVHAGGSPMSSYIARKVVLAFQQTTPPADEMQSLSPREREVLELLARGYLYKEIAERLGLSLPTISTHIRHIYEKLQVRSRAQAVAKFAKINIGL
jgi:DNA-binding NarL/FixJ family response regulator